MSLELTGLYAGREWDKASAAVHALVRHLEISANERLPASLKIQLERYLRKVSTAVIVRNSRAYPGGTSDSSLSKRSGTAMQSVRDSVGVSGDKVSNLQGTIGGVHYLRIHEFGGVIRPVRARYLTIPLPAALNSNGTPKKRTAREWNDTFIKRSKKGNLLIFQKRGLTITPLYVLKDRVYIPPRLGMSLTLDQFVASFLQGVLTEVKREFTV